MNLSSPHKYVQSDTTANDQKILYHIWQVDVSGRTTCSPVVMVMAIGEKNRVTIYPVPVTERFYVGNINPVRIKKLSIFNNNGLLINTWTTSQNYYDVKIFLPEFIF
jgi:hypothetical protein